MISRGNEESKVRSKLKVGSTEIERVRGKKRERQMGRDNTRSVKVREPTPSRASRDTSLYSRSHCVHNWLKSLLLLQSSFANATDAARHHHHRAASRRTPLYMYV